MRNKKSQIQMMETMAVLLVFFVILVIGFIFYIKTSSLSQEKDISKRQELESIRISQTISFLPELQCSSKNIIKSNCFDKLKLSAFSDLPDANTTYYSLFYYSEITFEEIYPSSAKWTLYNRTRKDSGAFKTTIPVILYDPIQRTNSFGVLNVKYYPIS